MLSHHFAWNSLVLTVPFVRQVQQESGDENTRKERRSATDRGDTSNKKQPSTSSGSSSADKGKSFVVVDRLTERDVFVST